MEKDNEIISTIKEDVKLQKWNEEIRSCTESGMTVQEWCSNNGINIKTYYYHLRKVRESMCIRPVKQSVVPLMTTDTENQSEGNNNNIVITGNDINITLPAFVNSDVLIQLVKELKTC